MAQIVDAKSDDGFGFSRHGVERSDQLMCARRFPEVEKGGPTHGNGWDDWVLWCDPLNRPISSREGVCSKFLPRRCSDGPNSECMDDK
jgi:hypothetical protein